MANRGRGSMPSRKANWQGSRRPFKHHPIGTRAPGRRAPTHSPGRAPKVTPSRPYKQRR